jgi:hypothetical protein
MKSERPRCQIHEREVIAIVVFPINRDPGPGMYIVSVKVCPQCFQPETNEYFCSIIQKGEPNANPRRG